MSPDNGFPFPVLVCDYCHDFISKFHIFFEFVKENQEKLTLDTNKLREEVIFVPEEVIFEEITDTVSIKQEKKKRPPKLKKNQIKLKESMIKELKQGGSLNPTIANKLESLKLFICDHCDKYYALHPKTMLNHIMKCKDKSVPQIPSYRRVPSKDELIVSCPLCPPHALKFVNDKVLQLHLGEHANFDRIDKIRREGFQSPLHACLHCERRFASDGEYKSHLKNHEKDAFMTCELCGRTTVAANLAAHLQNHFKKFFCEFCSLVCKSQYDLQKHINRRHTGPQYFECSFCLIRIKRKARLEKHELKCKGPGTISPCNHCGDTFQTNGERKKHIRRLHIGYHCRICQLEFENVSRLSRHTKSREHKEKSLEMRQQRARVKAEQTQKSKSTSKFLI